jgi:hypothetical protein
MATRQPPSSRNEQQVRFVREQDGEPERELKAALAERLHGRVTRAYLAVVDYGEPGQAVACCFVGTGDEEGIVREVATTFAEMFGSSQHLDVMWLTGEQEIELAKVARPFVGQAPENDSMWSRFVRRMLPS